MMADGSDLQIHGLVALLCAIVSPSLDHCSCEYICQLNLFAKKKLYNECAKNKIFSNNDFIFKKKNVI